MNNDLENVNIFLNYSADPNKPSKNNLQGTPLMYAASIKDGVLLDMLLEHGADVNAVDLNKDPALNWATYYGHTSNMQKLLDAGANPTLKSKHGDAVDVAFRLWHADSVINVFRNTILDEEITTVAHTFLSAVKTANIPKIEQLLSNDANPNTKDGLGMSALHHAVRAKNNEMASLLLKHQARADIFNRVGQTPLTIAARFGHTQIVKTLLQHQADVNKSGSRYALTPLIGAAVNGDTELLKLLIDTGAKINHQDVINEFSALHWALSYGNTKAAKFLLDHGGSYNLECLNNTCNAYTLAITYGNKAVKKYIEKIRNRNNPLLGSWKIKEIRYIYNNTTYKVYPPQGFLLIAEGRYSIMYAPQSKLRTAFSSFSNPTDEEVIMGFKKIVFNSGYYQLKDHTFIATPDIAKVPGFEGGKQYYSYSVNEDSLTFTLFDETYANGWKPDWYKKLKALFILEKE
ncbi:MAG: hypothetical protein FH748_16900 [Balneolaceae bacterium]|nr:hypothetical protein [Balneolaceae bacterium]